MEEFRCASPEIKDLIGKILVDVKSRIQLKEIFNHPWMKEGHASSTCRISIRKMLNFSKFNELKKTVAVYVASQLSVAESETYGQLLR